MPPAWLIAIVPLALIPFVTPVSDDDLTDADRYMASQYRDGPLP